MTNQPNQPNAPRRKQQQIKIEMPANLNAVYSNIALIMHTPNEFFVNFAQILPGVNKSQIHTRVVMTPTHAKLLYKALGENIERHEATQGEIKVPPSLADQLFKTIRGKDDDTPDNPSE